MPTSINEFVQRLRLILYGLLALPLLIFVVVYLRTNKGEMLSPVVSENFIFPVTAILILIPVVSVILGYLVFNKRIRNVRHKKDLTSKLIYYHQTMVIKFSFLEIALILSIAGLLITADQLFIILFMIIIFNFSIVSPSVPRLLRHTKISREEIRHLMEKQNDL